MVATVHTKADVNDRPDGKPVIVLDYNRSKGGVDHLDKVIGTYSCRRMTLRWPLVGTWTEYRVAAQGQGSETLL